MNISLVELVVAALAVWQIVEIWHHSSLTAPLRARAELLDADGDCGEGKLRELLMCPFCLSVWVAALVGVAVLVPVPDGGVWWHGLLWFLQFCLSWLVIGAYLHYTEKWEKKRAWIGVTQIAVAALLLYLLWWDGWQGTVWTLVWGAKLAVLGFALSRAANLGNDLSRQWCRTPQINKLDHTGDGDDDTSPPAEKEKGPLKIQLTLIDQRDSKTAFEKKDQDGGPTPTVAGGTGTDGHADPGYPRPWVDGDGSAPVRPGGV